MLTVLIALLMVAVLAACQAAPAQTTEQPAAAEEPAAEAPAEEPAEEPAAEEPAAEAETAAEEPASEPDTEASAGPQTFVIDSESSEARFLIDEVLMGNDKTVVGTTSMVEGSIQLDPANPGATEISTISIDASDFTTDSDRRNGAIRRFILHTGDYQFITFEPTAIEGLPDSVAVGDALNLVVTGDLTIRDLTNPVYFEVTVDVASEELLVGTANTSVTRSDFDLTIPEVPNVTDVQDVVGLEFDFQATPQ